MKAVEIRDLGVDDLFEKMRELREEMFNLRFQLATGQLDNHRRLRAARRDLARVQTVIREMEIEEYEAASRAVQTPTGEASA